VEDSFWTALTASLSAATVTSLGIWTIRRFARWGHHNTAYFMCFAAGMVLHEFPEGIVTYLLPKAEVERGRYSLVALAGGIAVAIVIVASSG
jgi:zinc transporter ZupT